MGTHSPGVLSRIGISTRCSSPNGPACARSPALVEMVTVRPWVKRTTIRTVWQQLAGEFPGLAEYERSISSALNADYARMDAEVHDGDEIAFLPPVSGG